MLVLSQSGLLKYSMLRVGFCCESLNIGPLCQKLGVFVPCAHRFLQFDYEYVDYFFGCAMLCVQPSRDTDLLWVYRRGCVKLGQMVMQPINGYIGMFASAGFKVFLDCLVLCITRF